MPAKWQTIRVFISSTFRDMHAERDWLVKRVFPALREKLEKHRVHLVDVDLRWGITEEDAQQDRVLDLCLQQIDECRPFFVGILGERYGWIPESITEEAVNKYGWIQHHTGKSVTELEILYGVLKNRKMQEHAFFYFRSPKFLRDLPGDLLGDLAEFPTDRERQTLAREVARAYALDRRAKLRGVKEAIRGAGLPIFEDYPCRYAGVRINWQLASVEIQSDADRALLREVADDGLVDPQEYARLDDRARYLVHRLGVVHLAGLEEFGRRVHDQLWQAIQREYDLSDAPSTAIFAVEESLAEENAYHEEFMESRLRVYVRRQDVQGRLMAFADGNATHPCLVTGQSGCGKSAALARFCQDYQATHGQALVIPHFVGASPASADLRQMLHRFSVSIRERFNQHFKEEIARRLSEAGRQHCQEWELEDKELERKRRAIEARSNSLRAQVRDEELERKRRAIAEEYEIPFEVGALAACFRRFCGAIPDNERVLFVIDAVNQLDETGNAHSMFWLPWELPSHVKMVISCTDGSRVGESSTEPVLQVLARQSLERLEIQPLTYAERREIIRRVPSMSAKKLNARQVDQLLSNPATENPLFLLVALEELRGFGSYEQLEKRIAAFPREESATVTALFAQVIHRLREEFDGEVVRSVLTFLACSRTGMSERELVEMIEGIDVEQSTGDVFPVLRQLRPYLRYSAVLLNLCDSLHLAVREQYLATDESRVATHARLADYFSAQDYFSENLEQQRARAKRLPPTPRPVNIHKVNELPYQRLEVAKLQGKNNGQSPYWKTVADLLTDWQFLESEAEAHVFHLVQVFDDVLTAMPAEHPKLHMLTLLRAALRRDIHFIFKHPTVLFQQLWNLCWWYDCPETAKHYDLPEEGCENRPPWTSKGESLNAFLQRWRAEKRRIVPGFRWLRSLRPPPTPLGMSLHAIIRGHENTVTSLAFSSDGLRIVSGSYDETVRLWDARSGMELSCLRVGGPVIRIAVSPDCRRIIPFCCPSNFVRDGTAPVPYVWDTDSGTRLWATVYHPVYHADQIAFSPNGREIVERSFSGARVLNAASGVEVAELRHQVEVGKLRHQVSAESAMYSPDGQRIVTCDVRTVRVWDAATHAEILSLAGHEHRVRVVAFSSDGRRIVSCSEGPPFQLPAANASKPEGRKSLTIGIWDAQTGERLTIVNDSCGSDEEPKTAVISSGGLRIILVFRRVLDFRPIVKVWDVQSGSQLKLNGYDPFTIEKVAVSANGTCVAGVQGRTVQLWDTESGKLINRIEGAASFAISPDGRSIITGAGYIVPENNPNHERKSGSVDAFPIKVMDALCDWQEMKLRGAEDIGDVPPGTQRIQYPRLETVAFSSDGQRIVTLGRCHPFGRSAQAWDAETGEKLRGVVKTSVTSLASSPDGRRIIFAMEDDGRDLLLPKLLVWDVESGIDVACLRGHRSAIVALAVTPDGQRIVSASGDKTVRVWDIDAQPLSSPLRSFLNRLVGFAFDSFNASPLNRYLSGREQDAVRKFLSGLFWGEHCRCLHGHEGKVASVAVSADGQHVVSGSYDTTVRVWSTRTGRQIHCLRGHKLPVQRVAISPDGRYVASIGDQMKVRIWDSDAGTELAILRSNAQDLAFSSDGQRLVTCEMTWPSEDLSLHLWETLSGECLEVIKGTGDLLSIAAEAKTFPFRCIGGVGRETVLESAETPVPVAWISDPMTIVSTHQSGRRWAGTDGRHLLILQLEEEGDPNSPTVNKSQRNEDTCWYYSLDGRHRCGPITAGQVRELIRSGKLVPTGKVSHDGKKWYPASKLKGVEWPDEKT